MLLRQLDCKTYIEICKKNPFGTRQLLISNLLLLYVICIQIDYYCNLDFMRQTDSLVMSFPKSPNILPVFNCEILLF